MDKSISQHNPSSLKEGALRHPAARFLLILFSVVVPSFMLQAISAELLIDPLEEDQINIVTGDDRTIFEYRQNGRLLAIKVVPKSGRPYYLAPAEDDGLPRDLEHARRLYPQWIILEW